MTDSFGFSADPDPGAPEGTSGNRRTILVAAGLAGVMALGAGAYFLLSGSPADPVTSVALYRPPVHRVIPPRHTAPAPAPTKPAPAAQLPTASLEHLGRNPFRVLYVQPVAVTSTAPTSGTGTSTGTGSTGAGSTDSGSTGSGSTGTGSGGTGSTGTGTGSSTGAPTGTGTGSSIGGSTGTGSTGSTSTGSTSTGSPSTGSPSTGSTGKDANVPSGTSTGGSSTGTPPPATTAGTAPYPLMLVSISRPSPEARYFTFTLSGVRKVVLPGQRFGRYGELVVLAYTRTSDGTATGALVQVGDDSPIAVRIGEKVTVL
jgi:hypothetical protein